MEIAAIDIGSNSIHMVIARATGSAGFEVVDREREVVQVGRGSFRSGRLRAAAIARTVEALGRFVALAKRRQVDRILCTATAAVREAPNAGRFIRAAREAAGITPRVIPPEEEGRLNFLAVKSALQLDDAPVAVVDIGGGSMQITVGNRDRVMLATSAPLGALRLTETLLDDDPPGRGDLERLRRHIRRHGRDVLGEVRALDPVRAYGSSGSIHALAQLAHQDEEEGRVLEHVNGYVLSADVLRRVTRRLQRMTLAERERLQGLDAMRAEIIVPGAMVLLHTLEELGLDGITISDFGVREGLVTDYLVNHAREISAIGQVEDLRLRSVLQLLQKFQPEDWQRRHARQVARLARGLFDGLAPVHGLDATDRDLLEFAALLHDVGAAVGYDQHAEHTYYLIRNGNLRGLSSDDLAQIAIVARYHGKGRPRKRDPRVRALRPKRRRAIRWLAGMLRVAEGLDRSHYQLVRDLRVRRRGGRITIEVATRRGAQLELWASRRRTDLLERLVGESVRVIPRRPAGMTRARGAAPPETRAAVGKPSSPAPAPAPGAHPVARAAILPLRKRAD